MEEEAWLELEDQFEEVALKNWKVLIEVRYLILALVGSSGDSTLVGRE